MQRSDVDSMVARMVPLLSAEPELAAVYLFGSFARGTAGAASDVDLGVVFRRRGEGARQHYRSIADLVSRLEGVTFPHPVDVVALEDQGPIFCHRVLLDGRLIHEAVPERRVDFESDTIVRALDFRPTYEIALRDRVGGLLRWLEHRNR